MAEVTAQHIEATIRKYFDGCNEADIAKMTGTMEADAVHYFPAGAPQGPFIGAQAIAEGWVNAVGRLGSIWTIDRMLVDASKLEAVIEWTHFKPKQGTYLRGDEWYIFSPAGRIKEIRAYYACAPQPDKPRNHELGGFDYPGRDYPLAAPPIKR
jgi:SnoaL-like domain